jgi:predicted amidohydrolase YtcJ
LAITGRPQSSHCNNPRAEADLVVLNAQIYCVDAKRRWASAMAVSQGRLIAIGDAADMSAMIGERTLQLDLGGRFVMPGLYDMHTHPDLALAPRYAGYFDSDGEDLSVQALAQALRGYAEEHIQERVQENAPDNAQSEWVFGQHFTHYQFLKAGVTPDKHWLDSVIPDRPAAIHDRSWGCLLANSKALALAGIDADTPDPANGYIERDPFTGEATGILVDGAYALIHAVMPAPPAAALQRAYGETIRYQNSRGVVASKYLHVCEHRLDALRALDQRGELTQYVEAAISWQDDIFPVKRRWQLLAGERHYYRSNRLNADAVKFHFDGTHGAQSAYLSSPWPGQGDWYGSLNMTIEHLKAMLVDLDSRGIRVIAHCVGDAASDLFLDAVAEARRRNGPDGPRHQCAHCTVLLDENLPRFAALNVTAEFSPVGWMPDAYARAREVMGARRFERFYNFKGVLQHQGNAVMGTDWPVSNINCWAGFETMITRQLPWGEDSTQFHGEGISLAEAIEVMTINGARAMDREQEAGSLEVGKRADFIVLPQNPFDNPARGALCAMPVDMTFLEGELLWDRLGDAAAVGLQPIWQTQDVIDFTDYGELAP